MVNFIQILLMDLQESFSQNWQSQTETEGLGLSLLKKIRFLKLNESLKLRQMSTIYEKTFMLMTQMRLIFNNGSPVPIKISHHNLANQYFNHITNQPSSSLHFSIDDDTLFIKTKLNGVKSKEVADKWIQRWSDKVLLRKDHILSFLIVIGYPIEEESSFMRRILLEKKKIKNKIIQILNIPKLPEVHSDEMMENEDQEPAVVYYGQDRPINIEKCPISKITQEQNGEKKHKMEGGYFSIDCQTFKITNNKTNEVVVQTLAMKTLREKRRNQLVKENFKKINKQLQIVKSIKDKTYLVNYYCEAKENPDFVLMDKYDHSLQEYIYFNGDSLQFIQKINIAKQVVAAVISLHKSKVVHRDIKPSNLLINDNCGQLNKIQLKIIDFAQSYSHNLPFFEGDYGCSHPYSPLQCSLKKSLTVDIPEQGLGSFQIDYWSVGITIYELFFQKHPVSYSRPFYIDICTSWKSEFLNAVDQRSKIGFQLIDDIITILLVKSMKFEQKERLNLDQMMLILLELERYVSNLVKILFTNK